ncbi:MAG: IclR family transcriptional regulator [Ilumatobacteraceae bacterium]
MSEGAPGRGVATIERAADVLLLFSRSEGNLGVTEIARELDISKAVVHRILTSLRERGLVAVDPSTRRYSLGPAVLLLAAAYRSQLDVRSLALDAMRHLSEASNETATLSVRHLDERIYVDQVTPAREVKMTVQIGASFPLHAGSSSKAFLAWLPKDERDDYLRSHKLAALTDGTITDEAELSRELDRIRRRCFAVSLGERQFGAASVAAPILDEHGEPVAAISVCGPIERFRSEIAGIAAQLVEQTRKISVMLGEPSGLG